MNSAYNFTLHIKDNCSWRPHFRFSPVVFIYRFDCISHSCFMKWKFFLFQTSTDEVRRHWLNHLVFVKSGQTYANTFIHSFDHPVKSILLHASFNWVMFGLNKNNKRQTKYIIELYRTIWNHNYMYIQYHELHRWCNGQSTRLGCGRS